MRNVLNLSEYVVQRSEFKGNPITNLKLQKILYYLQGYSLREFDKPAFCGYPLTEEAWQELEKRLK